MRRLLLQQWSAIINLLGLSGHIRGQHILALMSTIVFTAELVVLWTRMGVLTLPSGGVRSL